MIISLLRPRFLTLVFWTLLFFYMPSFFYSNAICRLIEDYTKCGWQFAWRSGLISLESFQAHARFLSVWPPYTRSDLAKVILGIVLNIILAYVYATLIIAIRRLLDRAFSTNEPPTG